MSSKTCKGLYKSLLNAARCASGTRGKRERYFMSGEDLTIQAGLALQQDLALVSLLGLTHVERNGHHYVNGMAGLPQQSSRRSSTRTPTSTSAATARCACASREELIQMKSLDCPGYASGAMPDWNAMRRMP